MARSSRVGYRRPPRDTQFKAGHSGNAKGRPKDSRNLKTDLREEFNETIPVKEGGVRRKVSKRRAMLKTLFAKALQGDIRAATLLLSLASRYDLTDEMRGDMSALTAEDRAVLARYEAQLRAQLRRKEETNPT